MNLQRMQPGLRVQVVPAHNCKIPVNADGGRSCPVQEPISCQQVYSGYVVPKPEAGGRKGPLLTRTGMTRSGEVVLVRDAQGLHGRGGVNGRDVQGLDVAGIEPANLGGRRR